MREVCFCGWAGDVADRAPVYCACGRKVTGADDEALFRQLRRHVDRDHAHPTPARTVEELRATIAARGYTELLDDADAGLSALVPRSAGAARSARPIVCSGTPIEMVLAARSTPPARRSA